jgi:hypothetical protein
MSVKLLFPLGLPTTLQQTVHVQVGEHCADKAISKHRLVCGFGQTRMISSKEIIFASGDGLRPGVDAEIVVAWPRLLDDRIPLQLFLQVTINGSQDNVTEARIRSYDFRTRRPKEVSSDQNQSAMEAPRGEFREPSRERFRADF